MSFSVNYVANSKMNVETKDKTLGIDVQRIDTETLEKNGEYLPVKSVKVYEQLVRDYEIRDNVQHNISLDLKVLNKCKHIDFVIRHDLDTDLRVAFKYDGPSTGNKVGDSTHTVLDSTGDVKQYGVASSQAYHIVKQSIGNINLSQTRMSAELDEKSANPYELMRPFNDIQLIFRAESPPSKGGISITLVGDTL